MLPTYLRRDNRLHQRSKDHTEAQRSCDDDGHIITLALDDDVNIRYRNPIELGQYIRSLVTDKDKMYYVFLDDSEGSDHSKSVSARQR